MFISDPAWFVTGIKKRTEFVNQDISVSLSSLPVSYLSLSIHILYIYHCIFLSLCIHMLCLFEKYVQRPRIMNLNILVAEISASISDAISNT